MTSDLYSRHHLTLYMHVYVRDNRLLRLTGTRATTVESSTRYWATWPSHSTSTNEASSRPKTRSTASDTIRFGSRYSPSTRASRRGPGRRWSSSSSATKTTRSRTLSSNRRRSNARTRCPAVSGHRRSSIASTSPRTSRPELGSAW